MEEFTASNGIRIREGEWGHYEYAVRNGMNFAEVGRYIPGSSLDHALAEYYRAKEDERLGRWRWPENTDFVVYAEQPGTDWVRVYSESQALMVRMDRRKACHDYVDRTVYQNAARAYFDAHPEAKPWHEAKPGDVWLLTFRDDTLGKGAYVTGDWSFIAADHAVTKDDHRITSARKIYPAE